MMRRLACVLVAAVVAASTVRALPLPCACDATIAGTHSCCAPHTASAGSATCCTIAPASGQPGPAEAVAAATPPAAAPIRTTCAAWASTQGRVHVVAAPAFEPVPLYLRQLSLLI